MLLALKLLHFKASVPSILMLENRHLHDRTFVMHFESLLVLIAAFVAAKVYDWTTTGRESITRNSFQWFVDNGLFHLRATASTRTSVPSVCYALAVFMHSSAEDGFRVVRELHISVG